MTTRGRLLVLSLNAAPEQTGNAPYVTALVGGLAEDGWSVRLVAAHPHYPQWRVRAGFGQWRRVDREEGVDVERLRHYVPRRPSSMRRLLGEISFGLRLCGTNWGRPDVVVMVSPAMFSSSMAMLRARLFHRSIPTVVWVQDLYGRGMPQTSTGGKIAQRVVARLESALLRAADRTVVIHERFRTIVVDEMKVPLERVKVIRNWSKLAEASPSISRADVRAAFGWSDEEIIVLHGGNQGVKQGLENVVEAARLADERGDRVRFVLLGHGSQHADLRRRAEGVTRIQFLDPMPDEAYLTVLRAADVLLVNELTSVRDMAVPSKLTNYFNAGRPVLAATEASSICAEEVERAGAGIRVQPGVPSALLDAALTFGLDPDRSDRMGASGAAFAQANLRWGAALVAFGAVLDDVVDRAGQAFSGHGSDRRD